MLAGLDAHLLQRVREPVGAVFELGVSDAPPGVHDREPVGDLVRGHLEQVGKIVMALSHGS